MMNKQDEAIMRHDKGYNCAQAVACSFAKELGIEEEIVFRMGEGFGLGMGCMCGDCGALSGAIMLAGLKNSDGNIDAPRTKGSTYKLSKEIFNRFVEKTGAPTCKELKGVETGKMLCSCPDCIKIGVAVAQEVLNL